MIDIFYDNELAHLTDRPYVQAAGTAGTIESTQDVFLHNGIPVYDVDEPNYDGSSNFTTADGTVVNNGDEWLDYLKKYCPAP